MTATQGRPALEPRFERPVRPLTTPSRFLGDLGLHYALNGLVGLVFAATGPVAVILSVGVQGGLSQAQLASWLFGAFFLNGALTVLASWLYRQPLAFFWTIPGTVLVGPALSHLAFAQIVGAYLVTAALMLFLGLSGWVRRALAAIPMPIVMGMVAGVFMSFGTGLVKAIAGDLTVAAPMAAVFVLLSSWKAGGARMPPVLGALIAGILAVAASGHFELQQGPSIWWAAPMLQTPQFSVQALVELVIPLAVTVLVVQNGQGIAVLRAADHHAPVNAVTIACGIWSLLTASVGAVSTCLTGPTNALLAASGKRHRHYVAAVSCGLLAMLFGLLAPLFTSLMLAAPPAFIATLGGLAMLRVLQSAFTTAFGSRFTLGALVAFTVTVSDITVLSIGAAFGASSPASQSPRCSSGTIFRTAPASRRETQPICRLSSHIEAIKRLSAA